jgi:hypothetical protein
MRSIMILCLTTVLILSAFSQIAQIKDKTNNSAYPFEITDRNGQYTIIAQVESAELFNKYNSIFERNGYSGNGYCWEGHITQILEKIDKRLLSHIDFDPEAGAFYAYADSKNAQQRFIDILCPIFTDLKKLEEYVKSADRGRVDD